MGFANRGPKRGSGGEGGGRGKPSSQGRFLSPPNKVSEWTMKRAPYVCVCVRPCVRACVRPGSKSMKNATSLSFLGRFWFCLFYLIGLWCGLQNFYTEFWNSLIMQIYANLFKINEKCYFSVISWPILIPFYLIGLGAGFKTSTQNFEIH